jgi:TP901 family phage tail tape measure protein
MAVIRVDAVSNTARAQASFNALTASIERTNAAAAQLSAHGGPSTAGFKQSQAAAKAATEAWTAGIAQSGLLRAEQVSMGEVISRNTDLLQRQKLAFNKTFGSKSRGLMKGIYREQLALQHAFTMTQDASVQAGRQMVNFAIPDQVHKSWDTFEKRIGMVGYQLGSAANQMVNWGKNVQWTGRQLSAGLTMPMVAFGAAAGYMAYQTDKQLTRIAKVYDTTASSVSNNLEEVRAAEKELMELREAGIATSIEASQKYGASATDTLQTQADLAATGQKGLALQKATIEVMRIATLGELDQQTATKATIALQQIFRQSNKELTESFDYMNAIENATSLTTRDFAIAIPIASATVREFGGDVQELGVLMTAMASRGIQAGKAANGIKAAMQRLGRPSKQVREEFMAITGLDIQELVDSSGSLTEIFQKLNVVTRDLSAPERRDVFAGLFGSYQVSTMTALVDGVEDIERGIGQTSDAYKLANRDVKEWADIAETEMTRYQESVSGKFKIAWETVRSEIATIGEPFLEVATGILNIINKMLKTFNKLPDGAKKAFAFLAIGAAAVGPLIMLTGLMANFAGSLLRAVAGTLRWASSFELLNKEQWASRATMKLMEKGFYTQATAAELLEKQIMGVTQAIEMMSGAMREVYGPGFQPNALMGPLPQNMSSPVGDRQIQQGFVNTFMNQQMIKSDGQMGKHYMENGKRISQAQALAKAEAQAAAAMKTQAVQASTVSGQMKKQAEDSEKTKRALGGAGVAMGVMSVASGVMLLNINDTTNKIAQWALIASLIVPSMKVAAVAAGSLAKKAKDAYAAHALMLKTQRASAATGAVQAGLMTKMARGTKAAAVGFNAMMGPVGWITLALTTAGFAIWKWSDHLGDVQQQLLDNQKALTESTEEWADVLGVAVRKSRQLETPTFTAAEGTSTADMAEQLKNSEDGAALVQAYKDAGTDQQKGTIAAQQYLDILNKTKATAAQARAGLEAMFIAAGDGALEAQNKARDLFLQLGDANDSDMRGLWERQISDISEGLVDDVEIAGTQIGEAFATSLAMGGRGKMDTSMDNMQRTMLSQWDTVIDGMDDNWQNMLTDAGVSTYEFRDLYLDVISGMSKEDVMSKYNIDAEMFGATMTDMYRQMREEMHGSGKGADQLIMAEKQIAQNLATQLGITKDINTLTQLRATWEWKLQTATRKNAQNLMDQRIAGIQTNLDMVNGLLGTEREIDDAMKLRILNQIRASLGMAEATSLAQGFERWTAEGANNVRKIAENAGRIHFNIKDDQLKDVLRAGYEGVSNDYADAVSANFDNAMQNAIDSNSKMWDTRIEQFQDRQERAAEAMDRRHERITEAFDKRWEDRRARIEKSYDKRIEKVQHAIDAEQKAEEIRQRIFEAEQSRLDRLTEAANRGIDFNMALQTGDLDEAAKIRNDMDAAAQQWALSDASQRGARGSDRRIEQFENRQDRLENQKDKALEQMEELEKARRKHLERRLEMEQKHLDKVQDARMKALEEESEAHQEAMQENWEQRRDNLDRQLDTFRSFIPKNQKQLENWIRQMGDDFRNFGQGTLNPLSNRWGGWFKKHLHENMRQAGREIGSDNMWEEMSAKIAKKTIKGMGFGTMGAFERFIKTGKLPDNFGATNRRRNRNNGNNDPFWATPNEQTVNLPAPYHTGGIIGEGGASRKGVARTAGLHQTEQLVLAQKGERWISRKEYDKHGGAIEEVLNGKRNSGGFGGGLQGLVGGILGSMFMGAAMRGLQNAFINKYNMAQSFSGSFGAPKAGVFGDVAFNAEQLQNASTIASVGKRLGASSRDIIIALMTAMQESTLRNLDWGDRDSVGLFQQRDAWGSFAARTNPAKAAEMFFKGGAAGQRGLFDFPDRDSMSLTEAAQAVQVSAYPSAYAKWENEARDIFAALRSSGVGYVPGPGGSHRPINKPVTNGLHDTDTNYPAVDMSAPNGTPVYAVGQGTMRYAEAKNSAGQWISYGRHLYLDLKNGPTVLYAHLSRAYAKSGSVAGGAKIGAVGDTGNSTGDHLHFGSSDGRPLAFLKTGGMTLNDGMAMLHRGETVLTEPLSKELQTAVKAFGSAGRDAISARGGYTVGRLQEWASRQVGKPYIWGGIGPGGYDCSGLLSSITALARGGLAHARRLFYTGNMSSVLPGLGFKRGNGGPNDFSVGWRTGDPGHAAGRIGNYEIESTGSHVRHVGANSVGSYPNQMHYSLNRPAQPNPTPNTGSDGKGDKTERNPKAKPPKKGPLRPDPYQDTGFWTYLSGMQGPGKPIRGNTGGPGGSGDGGPAAAGTPGTIRTGAYNVAWRSSDAQMLNALMRLAPKADVLSLNEVYKGKQSVLRTMNSRGWGSLGDMDSYVIWKKAVYDKIKGGTVTMNPRTFGGGRATKKRKAAYALLKNKRTGQRFWQIAAHTMPWPNKNARNKAIQREQYRTLGDLTNRLEQTAPVILAGDLNEDIRRNPINIGGLTSNWHKRMKKGTQTHGDHWIDHVMYNNDIMNLIGNQTISGLSSDHNAVLSQFNIPSHAKGAQNIRWDNTLINAHKGEGVLTDDQNAKYKWVADNIDKIAMGGGSEYNLKVEVLDTNASPDLIARKVIQEIDKRENRKAQPRRRT